LVRLLVGSDERLTSESVQGASLPLESIDNIHGGDGLPLGVFGVGDSISDDVLKENLEHSTGLLIDEARDTLDSSTASQTSDGGLGDSLDVVSQHFTVTLGASLSQSLSSFATSCHVAMLLVYQLMMVRLSAGAGYKGVLTNGEPASDHWVR
jgi:hypothetical protein